MLRHAIKIGLLLAALSVDLFRWLAVWHGQGKGWDILLMPKMFWLLTAALLVAAYVRHTPLRIFYAVLLAASTLFIHGSQAVIGVNVSYFDFVTAVDARSAFEDAFAMHGRAVILSALPAVLVLAGVAMRPAKVPMLERRWIGWSVAAVPLFAVIVLSALLYSRAGKTGGLPAPWLGLGYSALYGIDYAAGNIGERRPVRMARNDGTAPRDIVLVIDESVSGNYLDLTNPHGARSGLLDLSGGWDAANFGIASSITNCSMNSNVALRYGATRAHYQQIIATGPSVWAFAKRAGLRTVYLYGQRGGVNENYVSDAERAEIDLPFYFEDSDPINRDRDLAGKLAEMLSNDVAEFILVNKYGAHFPLLDVVPEDPSAAHPVAADMFYLVEAVRQPAGWTEYRQQYRKALEWSVGGFFDRLQADIADDAPPFTLIYTSDHGQNLHERGGASGLTHCRKNPAPEEGVVPLVIVENTPSAQVNWRSVAQQERDGRSQYRIFPTLLSLMGYRTERIREMYGPGLADPEKDPMTFGVEMYLRLGVKPRWIAVDPAQVVMPGQPLE